MTVLVILLGLLVASAQRPKAANPLHLVTTRVGGNTRVSLLAAPGLKLNARLKPALELSDGQLLRFDSPALTPDSAYFAEPPSALVRGIHPQLHGKLRASLCNAGESVCRSITIDL